MIAAFAFCFRLFDVDGVVVDGRVFPRGSTPATQSPLPSSRHFQILARRSLEFDFDFKMSAVCQNVGICT